MGSKKLIRLKGIKGKKGQFLTLSKTHDIFKIQSSQTILFAIAGLLLVSGATPILSTTFNNYTEQSFQSVEWAVTFGGTNIDVGYDVQHTTDAGYIISGYTRSYGASGHNVWLIKTNAIGNELWNKTFGGSNDDEGESVQQTTDGGYIIAGWTESYGAGLKDVWIIKTDASGIEQWNKLFGGSNDDGATSVRQTTDGGYIIAGYTSSYGSGSVDAWLIKTDASGNQEWNKPLGGYSSDGAYCVKQTTDGGYILTGWTWSSGPALGNVWLVKTDNLGNQQWSKTFGGSDVDRGYSVSQTDDGGYIVTGYTASSGSGLDDLYLIKTDSSGNEQWSKTFGGSGRDYGNSVQQTSSGGYIVTGYTLSYGAGNEDVWLVKTDSVGNKQWDQTYGGSYSDVGYSGQQTTDGGYIVTGHTLSYGAGLHDLWLIKIESDEPPPPPLDVNAGGPYEGPRGEPIQFTGTVTGGIPPYIFNWDFGDGNTSSEQNPTYIYSTIGNYTVILTVTDHVGSSSDDTTWAYIYENNTPPAPPTIDGQTSGKAGVEYEYTFLTDDPEDDNVSFYVEWGDGTNSGWTEFVASETEVTLPHIWEEQDTYTIRAKAKDILGEESNWGSLVVTMPVNQQKDDSFLLRLLERFPNAFPILRQLIEL